MKSKTGIIAVNFSAILFTLLFYKQATGVNLLIFEILYFCWLAVSRQVDFRNRNMLVFGSLLLLTALFTVITHSVFSYVIHYLALLVFVGILIYPEAKSLISITGISFLNIGGAQKKFLEHLSEYGIKGSRIASLFKRGMIFLFPVIIILAFIIIYRNSNPWFDGVVTNILKHIGNWINLIFKDFDFMIIVTFLIGLLISNILLLRWNNRKIIEKDSSAADTLERRKSGKQHHFKPNGLKNEYRAGVFLLSALNILILVMNVMDIYWVWFHFTWNGQYLKQFVHEGTYLLILSILISIFLILYYFRKNINFYSKNSLLKILSYLWLAQNTILALSVGIRNFWYIYYYALAYRRIGVIIFLVLTLFGLYSVFMKVLRRKSSFYLFRVNALAIYLVLVISSAINWDTLIARYNFSHADRSFLHLDYVASLSDEALPYLDHPLAELKRIDTVQKKNFPNEKVIYMKPDTYFSIIENRKVFFKKKWESKGIMSWNLPEYLAYKNMFGKQENSLGMLFLP